MTPRSAGGARVPLVFLGLLVAAVLVWWVFHQMDLAVVWTTIRTVRVLPLVLAVVLATMPFALRVPRWRLLLRHDDGSALPARSLWHAIAIGFAANNLLPYRAGELVRVAAIDRLGKVPFATGLSSVAVERVIDALIVVAMLALGLMAVHLPAASPSGASAAVAAHATQVGIACLVALLFAIVGARFPDATVRLVGRILPSGRVSDAILRFVQRLLVGLAALHDPRHAAPVLGWSVLIWLVNASAFYAAFFAFGIDVNFWGALIVQGAVAIGVVGGLTPGNAGVFEAAIGAALGLFGVDADRAFAYAVTYHITTFIPIACLGGWSAVSTGIGLRAPDTPAP